MKKQSNTHITFLGDGSWGTTLAVHLARKGFAVTIWGAFEKNINAINKDRENKKFLPGIKFPRNVSATGDLRQAVSKGDIIVLSTPSQYLDNVLKKLQKISGLKQKTFLSIVKGIETKNLMRMSELIHQRLDSISLAVLSGPTIAAEVAQKIPSSAVIASKNINTAKMLQKIFNSETFRIYINTDVVGVELGGSFKNVIAIACGLCDGLKFGTNTKSALLTRGLAEISRLGLAMGAKAKTFSGLTGLGDLVTTCFSPRSRNRHVGEELGKGKNIKTILNKMTMVAEGVETSKAILKLAKKYRVQVPIATEVCRIIYHHKKPVNAMQDLMNRSLKSE